MPLVSRTFDQIIDFTRTSSATFVGSNGLLQTTPASVNLLTYTQDFNVSWNTGGGTVTVTANSTAAPDGTSTADTITESTGTSTHSLYNTASVTTGLAYTWSGYVKPNGRTIVQLICQATSAVYIPEFDLNALTVTTRSGSGSGTVTAVGNGWYRITATATSTGTGTGYWQINLCSAANTTSYTGNGTSGIFLWGAQLEQAASATTYTRNFGGTFPPRFNYDPVTLAPRGLLVEEQRTNLATYSEQLGTAPWFGTNVTVTANTTVAPDGATTADTFDEGTATNVHRVYRQSVTYTATAHTASIFVKAGTGAWFQLVVYDGATTHYANFNASTGATGNKSASATSTITPVGNGWYRCAMTATTAATASGEFNINLANTNIASTIESYTGTNRTLFFWGAQLEAGAFATSYIPTVASQVTRTSDNPIVQAPNFAPWYNQPEGTFYVEFTPDLTVASNNVRVLTVSQAGAASRVVDIYANAGSWMSFNGTTNVVGGTASVTSATQKIASAYKSGSYALCLNGGTVGTASSTTVNSPTLMSIGYFPSPGQHLNGHIRAVRYYPSRLTDAQLQALTV